MSFDINFLQNNFFNFCSFLAVRVSRKNHLFSIEMKWNKCLNVFFQVSGSTLRSTPRSPRFRPSTSTPTRAPFTTTSKTQRSSGQGKNNLMTWRTKKKNAKKLYNLRQLKNAKFLRPRYKLENWQSCSQCSLLLTVRWI